MNSLLMLSTQLGEYSNYLPLINEAFQRNNRLKVKHPRHKARAAAQDVCFRTLKLSLCSGSKEAGVPGEALRRGWEEEMCTLHGASWRWSDCFGRATAIFIQMVILRLSHLLLQPGHLSPSHSVNQGALWTYGLQPGIPRGLQPTHLSFAPGFQPPTT